MVTENGYIFKNNSTPLFKIAEQSLLIQHFSITFALANISIKKFSYLNTI